MTPRHVVVFRFSALGDVAMTIPVIKLVLGQNPDLTITYVSTDFAAPLFADIDRLNFFAADLKGTHKGIAGLYRLSTELKAHSFDAIGDLHNVVRTKILRLFLSLAIRRTAVIDKGRKEKAELTRIKHKKLCPLKSTFQRYADVFKKLGIEVDLNKDNGAQRNPLITEAPKEGVYVGLAPFAKHAEKMYPLDKMKEVVALLNGEKNIQIFLFGSKSEAVVLEEWTSEFNSVTSLAGKMSFAEELQHIASLDLMISMDSANMHLASLFDVPVVSVWGATHPHAGFYGWKQPNENAVQVDLYCRPCSVFGNRKCYRGDHACMHSISPQMIYDRVVQTLYRKEQV